MKFIFTISIIFIQIFAATAGFDKDFQEIQHRNEYALADSVNSSPVLKKYGLYNFTSPYLGNIFDNNFRGDAMNRLDVDFDFNANSNSVPAGMVYALLLMVISRRR